MNRITSVLILSCCIMLTSSFIGSAQSNLTALQVAEKTYHVYKCQATDGIAMAHMDLRDRNGNSMMQRELVLMRKNVPNSSGQKWYAYFQKPADIRKMVFMVWKHEEKDDDRWIYLPAMDLIKRLAGSDKRSSFAGSQFVYEDVTGRYPTMDKHSFGEAEDGFYKLKSVPKDASEVEFGYYETWIDVNTFIPMKRVFYDRNGLKQREFRVEKTGVIQGYHSILDFSMTNLQTGESTYTTFTDLRYDVGIPDNIFEESYLRRTPRKWLRYNR